MQVFLESKVVQSGENLQVFVIQIVCESALLCAGLMTPLFWFLGDLTERRGEISLCVHLEKEEIGLLFGSWAFKQTFKN